MRQAATRLGLKCRLVTDVGRWLPSGGVGAAGGQSMMVVGGMATSGGASMGGQSVLDNPRVDNPQPDNPPLVSQPRAVKGKLLGNPLLRDSQTPVDKPPPVDNKTLRQQNAGGRPAAGGQQTPVVNPPLVDNQTPAVNPLPVDNQTPVDDPPLVDNQTPDDPPLVDNPTPVVDPPLVDNQTLVPVEAPEVKRPWAGWRCPCHAPMIYAERAPVMRFDGSMPAATCGRNPATGLCEWSTDACPEPPLPQECDANRPCQDNDYCDYPDQGGSK